MTYFVFIIAGAFLGLSLKFEISHFLFGGFLGWLTAHVLNLQNRLNQQHALIIALQQKIKSLLSERTSSINVETEFSSEKPDSNEKRTQTLDQHAHEKLTLDPAAKTQPIIDEELDLSSPTSKTEIDIEASKRNEQLWNNVDFEKVSRKEDKRAALDFSSASYRTKENAIKEGKPSLIDQLASKAKALIVGYFTGGNIIVRIGVLILFFGVAFLLKYAAERMVIPIEYRYFGLFIGALGLLLFGWKLRLTKPDYGLVLQGGAIGVLYLIIYAALQIHHLIGPGLAFGLLFLMVAISAALAILQNAKWLAVAGVTGGFLAPILVSTGSGWHVGLFTYYLILNLGIAGIAFYQNWRLLNWLGFMFTFAIGTAWGINSYEAADFATTEPFLIGFYLLYTLIPLVQAIKEPPELKSFIDGTLVFGTPVAFMGLQSQLVESYEGFPYVLAITSALASAMYVALAFYTRGKAHVKVLFESYLALAVTFGTLAVPFGFDGRVTSALWAFEGAALIWIGLKQARLLPRAAGCMLIMISAMFYALEPAVDSEALLMLNSDFIGIMLISIAGIGAGYCYRKLPHDVTRIPSKTLTKLINQAESVAWSFFVVWGYLWWIGGGSKEILTRLSPEFESIALQLFIGLSAILAWQYSRIEKSKTLFYLTAMTMTAGLLLLLKMYQTEQGTRPWLNFEFGSAVVYGFTAMFVAIIGFQQKYSKILINAEYFLRIGVWMSLLALLISGMRELTLLSMPAYQGSAYLLFTLVLFFGLVILNRKVDWEVITQPTLLSVPILCVVILSYAHSQNHFYQYLGWLAIPMGFIGSLALLKNREKDSDILLGLSHYIILIALTLGGGWQLSMLFKSPPEFIGNQWSNAVWGLILCLSLVIFYRVRQIKWPMQKFSKELNQWLPQTILVMIVIWLLFSNLTVPGSLAGMIYIPILNPIDLISLLALSILGLWIFRINQVSVIQGPLTKSVVMGSLAFIWANASMMRAFHYLMEIPYDVDVMINSVAVQSGFSILWTLIGFITMVSANKYRWRSLWLVGGSLLGVVVLKLFTVDMSASGTVERIIAFLSVGGLFLLIGYLAPMPPSMAKNTETSAEKSDVGSNL